jgi:hypothetical protein
MVNKSMNKIRVNRQGQFIDDNGSVQNNIVFEDSFGSNTIATVPAAHAPRAIPTPAWVPDAPPQPKIAPNEDDRCKNCGTMGQVLGMCCTCPNCGHTIWGA